jgi:hypothetical protein
LPRRYSRRERIGPATWTNRRKAAAVTNEIRRQKRALFEHGDAVGNTGPREILVARDDLGNARICSSAQCLNAKSKSASREIWPVADARASRLGGGEHRTSGRMQRFS